MSPSRNHAFGAGSVVPSWSAEGGRWHQRLLASVHEAAYRVGQYACGCAVARHMARHASLGPGCLLGTRAWCINPRGPEHIRFGEGVVFRGLIRVDRHGAGDIEIGDYAYLGDDTLISCADTIRIGPYTMLAHGVQIYDNDSHPLDPDARRRDYRLVLRLESGTRDAVARQPVTIGENVWIGFGATILKGVTVGDGAVIAAGSIVLDDVPARSLAAGIPARVLRAL